MNFVEFEFNKLNGLNLSSNEFPSTCVYKLNNKDKPTGPLY